MCVCVCVSVCVCVCGVRVLPVVLSCCVGRSLVLVAWVVVGTPMGSSSPFTVGGGEGEEKGGRRTG